MKARGARVRPSHDKRSSDHSDNIHSGAFFHIHWAHTVGIIILNHRYDLAHLFFLSFYFIFVCRCLDWTSALRRKWSLDASVAAFFSQSTTLLLMWLRYAGCEWRFSVERIWKMAIEYRIAGTHTFLFSIIWYYSEQSTGLVAIYMNSLASIGKGTSGSIVAGIAPACDGNKKEMMLEKRKRINIPHEIYQYSI